LESVSWESGQFLLESWTCSGATSILVIKPIDDLRFAVPGRTVSACIVGLSMALVGTIVNNRRTMRAGAWGIAVIYGVVGLFSLPLFHSMVHKYGFQIALVLGIVARILHQYIVVAGCAILESS
jgi:hypothetical protein